MVGGVMLVLAGVLGVGVADLVDVAGEQGKASDQLAAAGFLLDGYPRTVEQVGELSAMLRSSGESLTHVIELTVDVEEVVGRLVRRAAEQGRSDDTEDVVRRRLEVYTEQTAPLTAMYEDQGLLVRVDGMGSIDEVSARILAVLGIDA